MAVAVAVRWAAEGGEPAQRSAAASVVDTLVAPPPGPYRRLRARPKRRDSAIPWEPPMSFAARPGTGAADRGSREVSRPTRRASCSPSWVILRRTRSRRRFSPVLNSRSRGPDTNRPSVALARSGPDATGGRSLPVALSAMERALLLLAAPLVLAVAPSPASAATCGTIPGAVAVYSVHSSNIGCSTARSVARIWRAKLLHDRCADGRFRCRSHGFTCRAKPPAQVHYPLTCRRGQTVRCEIHVD
jgi:hypothetical protein